MAEMGVLQVRATHRLCAQNWLALTPEPRWRGMGLDERREQRQRVWRA